MKNKINLRNRMTGYVILFYFFPILFLVAYKAHFIPLDSSWMLFAGGIILTVCGSISLIFKLYTWESAILEEIDLLADSKAALIIQRNEGLGLVDPNKDENIALEIQDEFSQLRTKAEENLKIQLELQEKIKISEEAFEELSKEKKQLNYELEQLQQDLGFYQQNAKEQLKQKDLIIAEYSQTVKDLRTSMEKKQHQIVKLESSVNDLTYEVKTLLQLSDADSVTIKPTKPILSTNFQNIEKIDTQNLHLHNATDGSLQLKRCINIAQKLTGASHFEFSSRFRDFSSDNFALEQRRLFDSLRSETNSLVVVYSLKEDKLLFVNDETKRLLGWNPGRFIQEFSSILHTSYSDWKRMIGSLVTKSEVQEQLLMKTRAGQEISLFCHLGTIPTGIFKNHIIGVLYSTHLTSQIL